MATPVMVSRIQNRRGTQDQFDALYPPGYDGQAGFGTSLNRAVISNTSTSGDGMTVTVICDGTRYPVGTNITVSGVTPAAFNGSFLVTTTTSTQITYTSAAVGPITVDGILYTTYNPTVYPNILLPGELALCTDSRKLFVGNVNGGYVQLAIALPDDDLSLKPYIVPLPGNSTGDIIAIPNVPFYTVIYDVTDSTDLVNWDLPGTKFSRNGRLEITATTTTATLSDSGTEVSTLSPTGDINFNATVSGSDIIISYTNTFAESLLISASAIHWSPF